MVDYLVLLIAIVLTKGQPSYLILILLGFMTTYLIGIFHYVKALSERPVGE